MTQGRMNTLAVYVQSPMYRLGSMLSQQRQVYSNTPQSSCCESHTMQLASPTQSGRAAIQSDGPRGTSPIRQTWPARLVANLTSSACLHSLLTADHCFPPTTPCESTRPDDCLHAFIARNLPRCCPWTSPQPTLSPVPGFCGLRSALFATTSCCTMLLQMTPSPRPSRCSRIGCCSNK